MLKFLSRHRHPAIVPLESDTRPIELASSKEKERVTLFQHDVAYKRLLHAVRELQGAVRQLEVGLSSIQAGQLEHQGGLVRTLATVEELSAATEEVAAAAQTSATVAEHADHLAEQGRDAVRQAHQKMDHIKKAVQETGATVKELGQKTTAITRIVDVIREIAAETNLLSLNASIEAARAGEAGRGFAVVAGEVRQLSEQSATQAKQIEGVIKEIGEEISLVIARMNDSLAAVADGANVVEQADVALAAIVDAAGQVNEMVRQISAAATQQATGSSEILEVVSEMATTSEQVSYAIDKAMMDAAQQHSALERLNSLTLHLGDISQNLGDRTPQTKPLQHYRWCIGGDALTFDPHLCNEMTTTLVLSQIFMGLTRFGTDTRIVPGLARAWDLSPDGRTWTFQLRRGARFHNGREIKAADVKYSLERILRPATKSPNTWLVEMIQGAAAVISGSTQQLTGVRTEGDYTVHITLEYPYHPILANLAYIGTSIVPREVAELGKLTTQPIGAGPFQLANYEQGKRILLKAHTDFYGGRPFLDELELVPKLAANSDLEALNSGEVNHLLYLGAQNMHAIESHPLYANRIQSTPVLRTNYLGINCGKSGPLQNALVRQALNYAIDKETMIRELFGGRARVASGPLPPGCEGFDESIRPYPFDPNRAKAKLAEAGYPQGLPQPLLLHVRAGHEVQRQQAEMVRGWLAQIGIRLETKEIPWSELVTGACMRQCDLFFLGWTGDTGDPDNFLQPLFNSTNHGDLGNRTFFTNAEVDAKLAAGQSIRDPERRRKHYQELQRLLHELAPWVFLSYEDQFLVTRPEVRGLNLHPLGMVYLENAWLDLTQMQ